MHPLKLDEIAISTQNLRLDYALMHSVKWLCLWVKVEEIVCMVTCKNQWDYILSVSEKKNESEGVNEEFWYAC